MTLLAVALDLVWKRVRDGQAGAPDEGAAPTASALGRLRAARRGHRLERRHCPPAARLAAQVPGRGHGAADRGSHAPGTTPATRPPISRSRCSRWPARSGSPTSRSPRPRRSSRSRSDRSRASGATRCACGRLPVDLDAIARLDDLVQDALDGRLGVDDALGRWATSRQAAPPSLAAGARRLCDSRACALTPVARRRLARGGAAALVGLLVGAIALSTSEPPGRSRWSPRSRPSRPASAPRCSFGSGFDASADVVTLAALVTLLPGMTLTIGMRELATQHLQSGVANTASALVQLFGLAFGVAVGHLDRLELVRRR